MDDGERKMEFNTGKYRLLRSRLFGCHATLPSKESFFCGGGGGGALRDIQKNGREGDEEK